MQTQFQKFLVRIVFQDRPLHFKVPNSWKRLTDNEASTNISNTSSQNFSLLRRQPAILQAIANISEQNLNVTSKNLD